MEDLQALNVLRAEVSDKGLVGPTLRRVLLDKLSVQLVGLHEVRILGVLRHAQAGLNVVLDAAHIPAVDAALNEPSRLGLHIGLGQELHARSLGDHALLDALGLSRRDCLVVGASLEQGPGPLQAFDLGLRSLDGLGPFALVIQQRLERSHRRARLGAAWDHRLVIPSALGVVLVDGAESVQHFLAALELTQRGLGTDAHKMLGVAFLGVLRGLLLEGANLALQGEALLGRQVPQHPAVLHRLEGMELPSLGQRCGEGAQALLPAFRVNASGQLQGLQQGRLA